jgi:hypothetical protein
MVTKLNKLLVCSICGHDIEPHPVHGWAGGNNAQPINDGRCCDNCNSEIVIPVRMMRLIKGRYDAEGA